MKILRIILLVVAIMIFHISWKTGQSFKYKPLVEDKAFESESINPSESRIQSQSYDLKDEAFKNARVLVNVKLDDIDK